MLRNNSDWQMVMKQELTVLVFCFYSINKVFWFHHVCWCSHSSYSLVLCSWSTKLCAMALGAHKRYAITHPTVVEQSKAGKFTFRKLYHSFSALPLVQTHNQNNKAIKGDGGAIGLAENQKLRWMIGGREIASLVLKFEDPVFKDSGAQYSHHEQVTGKQNRFQKHVKQVEEKFAAMGSPFMDDSTELVSMVSKSIADESVVKSSYGIEDLGREKYHKFVQERFIHHSVAIDDPCLSEFLLMRIKANQACLPSISDCGKLCRSGEGSRCVSLGKSLRNYPKYARSYSCSSWWCSCC